MNRAKRETLEAAKLVVERIEARLKKPRVELHIDVADVRILVFFAKAAIDAYLKTTEK